MEKLKELLEEEVKKVCKAGRLELTPFVKTKLIPDLVKVALPSYSSRFFSKQLKLKEDIKASPELNLRVQELKKFINARIEKAQSKCDKKTLWQDFLEDRKAKSLRVVDDEALTAEYGKGDLSKANKAKVKGVVLRRSPKYVSIISLDDQSNEVLVEIGEPFHLLGVKIRVGDVLRIISDSTSKTKDLNPELLCCYDIPKDEVDTFFKNLRQLTTNPFGILEEFGRSLAVWQHILDVSIMKEEKEQGKMSKDILEICKIFSDLQTKTQMTTTMKSFWNALEDSKFFNEVLPNVVKNEAWLRDNVTLVQIFLENLLKAHPECAVRLAPEILERLTCNSLFSIIAPFVIGASEKPNHLKWNQRSVIPLFTELQCDPKFDYEGLQPVRVREDEDADEKKSKKGIEKEDEIAYESEEEYIKTYYTLLREECFHKTKKGIYSFLKKGMCDPKDNMLYCFKIIGISDLHEPSIQEGLSLMLELCQDNTRTSETENDDPDNSKWLMLGNLVCLSLDATFKNPIWGIISKDRTVEDRKQKHVHVSLCTKSNRLKDSDVVMQLQELKSQGSLSYMIESNTFYLAYGPPLEVLKKKVTVPFAEQLVKVKKSPSQQQLPDHSEVAQHDSLIQWMFAKLPRWIQSFWYQEDKTCEDQLPQHSGPCYLSHITKPPKWDVIFENPSCDGSIQSSESYDIVQEFKKMREDPESRPKLDDKQLDAVEQALFNKVALIQGPPGTGKSFVGKALLHLLLSMEVPKHGPILIVTYKNHSLDEFLESFLEKNPEFKKDVVRVGRSKEGTSELLSQCNLSQLARGRMEKKMYQNVKKLEAELNLIKKEIDESLRDLDDSLCFTASVFLDEADEKQLKSLFKNEREKLQKLEKNIMMKHKYWKELLKMIESPLKAWLPSEQDFKSFADKAGLIQANNAGCPPSSIHESNNQSDSDTEKTNEEEDSVGHETQPSDDLEERQGALLDQVDSIPVKGQTSKPAVTTQKEVLVTLPVIHDEKLGNFKSFLNAGDITQLNNEERIQFVYALQRQYRKSLSERFKHLTEELSQKQQRKKEIRNQHHVNLLKECKVVFMTVSGAAIRASWLESIKPSVMIVEEAAEILESQLVAVIPTSVQHLIMIGDHQQLRPQVHYEVLCRKCNFHISMFERLIRGGLEYAQLNKQGRMSDDIAELVRKLEIYDDYQTRKEVVRENHHLPKCLKLPLYFFNHKNPVKPHPSSHSKYNIGEARQIIKVAKFLLKKGVSPQKITILCSYRGQVNEFKKLLGNDLAAIKVTTIDSFQGKENDIILLSLVSNIMESQKSKDAKIGYLKCENRLCVAISRARCGLYLFGNADLLSDKSKKCWKKIIDFMRKRGCLGKELSQFLTVEKDVQCIKKKSIGEAPNTASLRTELKILLEPEKPLTDNFALLAEMFGLDNDRIVYLKTLAEPTEGLLRQFSHCTIGELQDKVKRVKDLDVRIAVKVQDYIVKNCECFECAFT